MVGRNSGRRAVSPDVLREVAQRIITETCRTFPHLGVDQVRRTVHNAVVELAATTHPDSLGHQATSRVHSRLQAASGWFTPIESTRTRRPEPG
jgi:hypothetical protein